MTSRDLIVGLALLAFVGLAGGTLVLDALDQVVAAQVAGICAAVVGLGFVLAVRRWL